MRNPFVVAQDALSACGLTERLTITGGRMVEGMWSLGILPKKDTVPLGGLTRIVWRISDPVLWAGGVGGSPLVAVVSDYRFRDTSSSDETSELNTFLETLRAELSRPEETPAGEPK